MLSKFLMSISAALLVAMPALPVLAAEEAEEKPEDWIMDTSGIGQDRNGVIRNDQILEMGVPTASALQMEGESSLRMGNVDRALVAIQRSIELAPMDADKRILYAETLEKKLMAQKSKERDPRLYNFLIKQWLFVAMKSDFPDQQMQGRAHLGSLTGTAPKMFEKPHKFLARVLLPEDGSMPVKMGGDGAKKRVAVKSKDEREMEKLD